MLEYLIRKEKILLFLKEGLTNKGYSFKVLSSVNSKLDLIKEFKYRCSIDILKNIIENTNFPEFVDIIHGLDNIYYINKNKSDWYLYSINIVNITDKDIDVLKNSFLNSNTLIYESEKNINSEFNKFYVIFSKDRYVGSQEYISHRWQGR